MELHFPGMLPLDYQHPRPAPAEPRFSRLAVLAWTLSIFSLGSCGLLGVVHDLDEVSQIIAIVAAPSVLALALNLAALMRIRQFPHRLRGRHVALWGIAVSAVALTLTLLAAAAFFFATA